MFSTTCPPVFPSSPASASAALSSHNVDLLELARAVTILTQFVSAGFPAPAPVPPLCSPSCQHRPHCSTPGGVVHNAPQRGPANSGQHSQTQPLHSLFNPDKSNEPDLAFERWKAQVSYPRRNPPTTTSPVPRSPTTYSPLPPLHAFSPTQQTRHPSANVLTKSTAQRENQFYKHLRSLQAIPTIYLGPPPLTENSEPKANNLSHNGLEEFLEEFKDVEAVFSVVPTRQVQSSFESSNRVIALDSPASVSSSMSFRTIPAQSSDFPPYSRTVVNSDDEDPAECWPRTTLNITPIVLEGSQGTGINITFLPRSVSETLSEPSEDSSACPDDTSYLENESSLAWYLSECFETEAGIEATILDHSSLSYHDPITHNTTIPIAVSQSREVSPTPLEAPVPRSAITATPDNQIPLDWDLSLCLDSEPDSDLPVDTSIGLTDLKDCALNATTAVFTSTPTHEEPSKSFCDPILPTILAIPTPFECVVISKLRRQHPVESSITSMVSNERVLEPTPAMPQDQRVFDRESAISGHNILKLFFKPFNNDVPNPRAPPSTLDAPGSFSKPTEDLSTSSRPLKDLPAISLTTIKHDPPSTIPKDRELNTLIRSLQDLLAPPRLEDNKDPANRMPVTASIRLEDRVPNSASHTHKDRSVPHVESAVALSDVLGALSGPFDDSSSLLRITKALEDEEVTTSESGSFLNISKPSYPSDVSASVPPAVLEAHATNTESLPSAVDDPSGDIEISSIPSLSLIRLSSAHDSLSSPGSISLHPLPASSLASVSSRPVISWLFVPILRGSPVCLQTSRFFRPLLAFANRIPGGNLTTLATQLMLRTPPFDLRAVPQLHQSNTQEPFRFTPRTIRSPEDPHRPLPQPLPRLLPSPRLPLTSPFSRIIPRPFIRSHPPFLSRF